MVLPFLTRAKMLNQTETSRRVCQTKSDDETEEEKTMDRILLALVLKPSLDIGARFYICTEPSLGNECKETHKEEPDEYELRKVKRNTNVILHHLFLFRLINLPIRYYNQTLTLNA